MTTESQQIIDRYFKAYAAHDLDAVSEVLAEDVTWHFPGHHPLSGTKRGIEEVVAFFDEMGQMQLRPDKYVIGANDGYVLEAQRVFSIDDEFPFETETCVLWKFAVPAGAPTPVRRPGRGVPRPGSGRSPAAGVI